MFNDNEFRDKFNLSSLDVKDFLRCVYDAIRERAVKLAEIGGEKARRRDDLAMSMSQFL